MHDVYELDNHSFNVVTGRKSSAFHSEFGYQSKSFRVVKESSQ